MKYIFTSFLLLLICSTNVDAQCNGFNELCGKRYDEVAYLTTHNAFNSEAGGFSLPNQNFDIATQLNEGVRAFMIDVYTWFGTTVVYHGTGVLGTSPLVDELNKISSFLSANPNEIVTVILEANVSANDIETSINASGLNAYLYTHSLGTSWPTLQEMIDADTRLVILSDVDDASGSQAWYHYVWAFAVETHFSANSTADFNCDFNRGDSLNDLFIFNHFITNSVLGTGMPGEAAIINANPYFIDRVRACQLEKSKFPNFITVDFYDLGDSKLVVDELNDVVSLSVQGLPSLSDEVIICPNPSSKWITLKSATIELADLVLISPEGKDVTNRVQMNQVSKKEWSIDVSNLEKGMYIIKTAKTANAFNVF
ncbi:MAG: hypothetical protein ACI865_002776 [Flavobacteriaceae bacterium]|jgi:hypothetical protein